MKDYQKIFEELKECLDTWSLYVMEQTRSDTITLYGPNGEEIVYTK